MGFEMILALPEGPERTTVIVEWIQSLYADDDRVPVLVDGANAFVLYRTRRHGIDHERLQARATEEGFEDALRALLAFDKEWSLSDPDDEVLEEWANRGPATVDE